MGGGGKCDQEKEEQILSRGKLNIVEEYFQRRIETDASLPTKLHIL